MTTEKKPTVADIITNLIIERLEAGCIPWRQPWQGNSAPRNLATGRPYRGINAFLLGCTGKTWFATFNQVKERGGTIKAGARSLPVVFWKLKEVTDSEGDDDKTIPILRYYKVFSLDDVEGVAAPTVTDELHDFTAIESAERVIAQMPLRPEIKIGQARAYYSPSLDYVNMPRQELFRSDEEWYSTLFHELGHATGHANRLNRSTVTTPAYFASADYSKEELIAECCSAFLANETGISAATIDNSAAYINGWLKALRAKDNRGMVIHAAAAGQRAADYILNRREASIC